MENTMHEQEGKAKGKERGKDRARRKRKDTGGERPMGTIAQLSKGSESQTIHHLWKHKGKQHMKFAEE